MIFLLTTGSTEADITHLKLYLENRCSGCRHHTTSFGSMTAQAFMPPNTKNPPLENKEGIPVTQLIFKYYLKPSNIIIQHEALLLNFLAVFPFVFFLMLFFVVCFIVLIIYITAVFTSFIMIFDFILTFITSFHLILVLM